MQQIDFKSYFRNCNRAHALCVFLLSIVCLQAAQATENDFLKAEVYFIRWNIETRERLLPDDVRIRADVKTVISDPFEVGSLVDWLRLDEMQDSTSEKVENARLVIDLFSKKGERTTYYASWFSLVSSDGLKWKQVDPQFRAKFTFGVPRP